MPPPNAEARVTTLLLDLNAAKFVHSCLILVMRTGVLLRSVEVCCIGDRHGKSSGAGREPLVMAAQSCGSSVTSVLDLANQIIRADVYDAEDFQSSRFGFAVADEMSPQDIAGEHHIV